MTPDANDAVTVCTARVKLRARRHVLWLRRLWESTPGALGLSISFEEVERLLVDEEVRARAEEAFYRCDPAARALAEPIRAADAAVAADPLIDRLRHQFDLDDADVDLLTLTVAAEADPWLRRAYAFIHDDATSGHPSQWLAGQLFGWPPAIRLAADSNLVRWRLARPIDGQPNPWSAVAAWAVDPFVTDHLLQGAWLDPELGDAVRLVWPTDPTSPRRLYPAALASMADFVNMIEPVEAGGPRIEIFLSGAPGAGKRTLVAQLCAELKMPVIVADADRLLGSNIEPEAARLSVLRVERSARMLDAAVLWRSTEEVAASWRAVAPPRLTVFDISGSPTRAPDDDAVRRVVRLPSLAQADRAALWADMSPLPVPDPVLDWALLPADIARAAAAAAAGPEAVFDACRGAVRIDASALARRLPLPYTWDDIVLSAQVRRHIEELEAQARSRWPVYEQWGFGRLCSMGRGITALFAGPSGTGKTMAAQVVAAALGMELYRVDLAGVVSKYIGETEKHLREVFDGCERANVLLFFDEADALFGRRTEVKDAHDRFANIEIDYLMQRMEQFDGIAVLATNRKHEIDDAFLRRFRFIIDFLPPGVEERRELWTKALLAESPAGEQLLDGIDFDFLADRLTMTGADIKGAAMAAAFLAHAEGTKIGMPHVMHAVSRELAKHGQVLRAGVLQ